MKKVFSTIISLLLLINLSSSVTVLADTTSSTDNSNANTNTTTTITSDNGSVSQDNQDNNDTDTLNNDVSNTTDADEDKSNTVTKSLGNSDAASALSSAPTNITYEAHVSKIGWQGSVNSDEMAGTTGKALPIEALKIGLTNQISGVSLKYQAHVSKIGWQDWVSNGEVAGTTGRALPIEAIKISLSGLDGYSIQYQVHVRKLGWQNWVSDSEMAGSTGKALPIEAIRIRIVKTIHPDSFNISKNSLSLGVGDSEILSPTFVPSDTTNEAVTWKSSNESVATVDVFGKVTAVSAGHAVITSTSHDGNLTASCNVTVNAVPLKGISLSKSTDTIYVGKTDTLQPIFTPSNASDTKVTWTSSNSSIATVDENGVITGIKAGTTTIKAVSEDGSYEASCNVTIKNYDPSVTYQAYCQNIGWQNNSSNGAIAGTTGRALRMEAIVMKLSNVPSNASITYQAYVEGKGWSNVKSNGETAGYAGASLRLEAIKINLANLQGYSVQYRTYVQKKGWMPWVTNGNTSGTIGRSLRIEAIQVKLVKSIDVTYNTYQQKKGWTGDVHSSAISSTDGQPLRIEAYKVTLNNAPANASIQYQAHVQNEGWQNFVSDGQMAGTTGKALMIDAICAKLVNLPGYTLQYQVFVQSKGWSNWINGGSSAGYAESSLRIEGLRMRIIENPETTILPEVYQSSYALTLGNYLDNTSNIQSVNATAVALHGGITSNNCVFFSSEALRRTGISVPTSMCNTGNYSRYLSGIGFVKNYEIDNLAIGDICFSVNGSYGYPTHTYVFMGWVNPDDHTRAYVADNQAGTIHIRSMIQTTIHDAFAFSMHK